MRGARISNAQLAATGWRGLSKSGIPGFEEYYRSIP